MTHYESCHISLIIVLLISLGKMISNNSHFEQIEPQLQKRLSDHIFNRGFKVVPQRSPISFLYNPRVEGPKLQNV